jgi:C1A family cysteine protease
MRNELTKLKDRALERARARFNVRGVALSPEGRRYDWRPERKDPRDRAFRYSDIKTIPREVPREIDLRLKLSPVFNQETIGSCTAQVWGAAVEKLQLDNLKRPGRQEHEYGENFEHVSRLYIYWYERVLGGTTMQDAGAYIRDGAKALARWGVPREKLWEYRSKNLYRAPTGAAVREAENYKISSYWNLDNEFAFKQCLAEGYPIAFGFPVPASFESEEVRRTGRMPKPNPDESDLGGHAVLKVGYNDDLKLFEGSRGSWIVRNSWGAEWGDNGYFYMSYEHTPWCDDFWTVRK